MIIEFEEIDHPMTASQGGGQPSVRYCSVLTHGVMSMPAAFHAPIRTLRCGPSFDRITGKGGALRNERFSKGSMAIEMVCADTV
jgi:hypothetical protein